MFYKIVIFLAAMVMSTGYPTTSSKALATTYYSPDGVSTIYGCKDVLAARAKVSGTTHAANDTLFSQFAVPNYGTSTYSFKTYVTVPRCDSLKVYIGTTKVYTYNYTATGFVNHSFTFTANPITPQKIRFVTVYGDTLAGSWYLENLNVKQ